MRTRLTVLFMNSRTYVLKFPDATLAEEKAKEIMTSGVEIVGDKSVDFYPSHTIYKVRLTPITEEE